MSQRERLKQALYDDSHAWEDDHSCQVKPQKLPPFVISDVQCKAVDDTAGLEP